MKIYERTEQMRGYENITTVTESGEFHLKSVWSDGVITSEYKTTVQEMGWASVAAFLAARKGFKEVTA